MLNEFTKKEAPIQGLAGLGGGVSSLLTLASGTSTYIDDVFSTFLYDGNSSTQTITNGIDLTGEGGLVWIKSREDANKNHHLYDTERGAGERLSSNLSNAEVDGSSNELTAFTSSGFTLGISANVNSSSVGNYASWTFRKAPGFFDVVTYTGNATSASDTQAISHSLGSVPGFIIVKRLNAAEDWTCYHRSLGSSARIDLNSDGAAATNSTLAFAGVDPTSTEFTVGYHNRVNNNGDSYVAYVFAHNDGSFGEDSDEAVIKCGSYTGDGTDNNFVTLGFEPQFLLIKNATTGSTNWMLFDVMRGMPDVSGATARAIYGNTSAAEAANNAVCPSATGFTPKASGSYTNTSGDTFIYMAIRRPHKPPESATEVFAMDINTQGEPEYVSNFVVDWAFHRNVPYGDDWVASTRLLGPSYLVMQSTAAESSSSGSVFDFNDGWGDNLANNTNYRSWMFRRAPGFFDVVAYTGTGSQRTINHNLDAVPEMMIIRERSTGDNWAVFHETTGTAAWTILNSDGAKLDDSSGLVWNNTAPTASVFSVGTGNVVNQSGDNFVAFLFATLSGISKVGSYSGTGSNVDVDCGFTAGARFILIKRGDAAGDWYVYDSDRGIVSGNDPYLVINEQDAEVTNTDYIDPLNAGFTVTSSAPAGLNASGGNYIFLAIA